MKISNGTIQQMDKSKPRSKCKQWRLQLSIDGKRKQKRFSGSYTDAKAALAHWRESIAENALDGLTLASYAQRWYDVRAATGDYSNTTLANDRNAIDYICRSPIGNMDLSTITLDDCETAMLWIRDNPKAKSGKLSGSTMIQIHAHLRSIFKHAELSGLIATNPTMHLKAPKSDTREKTALTPLEIELLLNRLDAEPISGYIMSLYLMLTLGLRRGESLALSFADIHDSIAHVHTSLDPIAKTIGDTKTSAGVRSLPMPQRLTRKLAEWTNYRDSWGIADAQTIACDFDGSIITAHKIEHWWFNNRERLGCENITLHQLRHSNLSMMARVVPSAFDLQRWAGWSSINPARVYIHADIDALTAAVSSVLVDNSSAQSAV